MQNIADLVRQEVLAAEKRIRVHIFETLLVHSPLLSRIGNANVFFKCENMQITNAFKLRGAMNKILSLEEKEKKNGVTTASTGNHGSAVAYLLNKFNIKGSIFLPENAAASKIEIIRGYGADLQFHGDDCLKAELKAKEEAQKHGMVYISPYNDMKILGGQGTIGVELMRQNDKIDTVICPVGGGGLIAGIAGYLKSLNKNIEIIGALPRNCPYMYEAIKAGKIIDIKAEPTLADGVEGALEPGTVTLDICRECVDDYILVSEDEIREALLMIIGKHFMLAEGAGALSTAAFLKENKRFANKNAALIISGGKIGLEKLKEILLPPAARGPHGMGDL
ncbi:threonine/serine dehydratase [Acidobacteriota bacterium]